MVQCLQVLLVFFQGSMEAAPNGCLYAPPCHAGCSSSSGAGGWIRHYGAFAQQMCNASSMSHQRTGLVDLSKAREQEKVVRLNCKDRRSEAERVCSRNYQKSQA